MAPFTTFFGDYNHGLWITWESIEDYGANTLAFKATFQANYRARLYKWVNEVAGDAVDGSTPSRDFNYQPSGAASPLLGGALWGTKQTFQFYVAWTKPTQTAPGSSKDGIWARTECQLRAGAQVDTSMPTLNCAWLLQDSTNSFDIAPTANWDTTKDANGIDNVEAVAPLGSICSEVWQLSTTSIACVEMQGAVKRKFNTGDTTYDFVLEYTTYKMHAKFGTTNDNDTAFRFTEQDVNFIAFTATEQGFANFGYATSGLAVLGSLFAMLG